MNTVTKGIVLMETPFKENSKILQVLTEDYGLIGIMSKGCRPLKSKLRAISNKLIYAEFNINYKENGLSTLIDGNIIDSFKNFYTNYQLAMYAYYLINLTYQTLKDNNDQHLFNLLRDTLVKMNEGINPDILSNIFELQLLDYLGVSLNMDNCSLCDKEEIYNLSIKDGGVICSSCYQEGFIFNKKTINLIKKLLNTRISSLINITIEPDILNELNMFINEYYNTYTGLYIRDKKNFKKTYS